MRGGSRRRQVVTSSLFISAFLRQTDDNHCYRINVRIFGRVRSDLRLDDDVLSLFVLDCPPLKAARPFYVLIATSTTASGQA